MKQQCRCGGGKPSRTLPGIVLGVALAAFVTVPAHANREEEPTAGAMVADALIARPLGLVATVLGGAAFIVSLPFSAAGGNVDQAADKLVMGPVRETFVRCLGCRSEGRYQRARSAD